MYEHLRTINKYGYPGIQATPVSLHFNDECQRPAKLKFQILETIQGNPDLASTTTLRKKREKWWILSLRSLDPMGMNKLI
jgi:hypothetical protein